MIVQVQLSEYSEHSYAYEWSGWLGLKIGAWVEVPGNDGQMVGRVVGIGRNGYDGPVKAVTRRASDPGWATEVVRALASSESGSGQYLIRQFSDGVTLCECPAWRYSGGRYETRSCKHTDAFHQALTH